MGLSPDHRYLYANSQAWPAGWVVSDPMSPPPIAEAIDLHVIDLKSLREERRSLRAHRAFTPNDECFFIFLDVSRDFVVRYVCHGCFNSYRQYGVTMGLEMTSDPFFNVIGPLYQILTETLCVLYEGHILPYTDLIIPNPVQHVSYEGELNVMETPAGHRNHLQLLQKVFTPLDFFHILLR
uniref:Uncharacterized protein n=1 Tax=Hucho hucho TaxID=62062 RepID=A0A4W5JIK3_9TELE